MKRSSIIFILCVIFSLGILKMELLSGDYIYTVTSFSYSFTPLSNKYNWQGSSTHKDRGWVDNFTVEVSYHKLPGNIFVTISKNRPSAGQSWTGKLKAKCNEDPILYGGVPCSPCTTVEGKRSALPDELISSCNLCAIGIMLPVQTRETLRKEYE